MIEVWSQGPADAFMPEEVLVKEFWQVRGHPWWQERAKLALAIVRQEGLEPPARILEAGCGWGVNLEAFEGAGYETAGLDVSRRILEMIDRPERRLFQADLTQGWPVGSTSYDAVLALDVLEHLDDDAGAIRRLAGLLRPGGLIVASVPALPELFSEFDRVQGHRRRYLPETLRAAFADSPFGPPRISYWGAWMRPILLRMRKKAPRKTGGRPKSYGDYLRLPPWPGPLIMRWLFAWEKAKTLAGKLKTGTSLFAVARRATMRD